MVPDFLGIINVQIGRTAAEAEQAARVSRAVVGLKSRPAPAKNDVRSCRGQRCADGLMSRALVSGAGLHAPVTAARCRVDRVTDKGRNLHERRRSAMAFPSRANSDGSNPTVAVNSRRPAVAVP
jgi:hypothetical protein